MPYILIIFGIALVIISVLARKNALRKENELRSFISLAKEYEAVVLDTPAEKKKRSAVIQIRIEEQKRTLVHRCTEPFCGEYKRGDRINVYLIEQMPADRSLIKGDNRFEKFISTEKKLRLPARIFGSAAAVIGIILLFLR
ncbi:MAG: hypothetical protein ACI4J0_11075 [Huintestinicola sp.]|uniref:hypothetical protein n=1 Tax=Huintestinicola sp. TaxID=2981661 RepID=UPI003F022BD4